jgi:DNA helicase-2/ATP-dependent DNA helicase PcrA
MPDAFAHLASKNSHNTDPQRNTMPNTPSPYQTAIYDFLSATVGKEPQHLMIDAVAGSGKTTVLVQASNRLPATLAMQSVFLAFNKHIAEELKSRLPAGMTAATIHSLGYKALKRGLDLPRGLKPDTRKYDDLVKDYCQNYKLEDKFEFLDADDQQSLGKLVELAMLNLCDLNDEEALTAIIIHHGMMITEVDYVLKAVPKIINRGMLLAREGVSVGFTDMVYLPVILKLTMDKFPIIFCDECQDLNACQRRLVMSMCAPGGTMVFVGDPNQSIYGFAGASVQSFEDIRLETGAHSLPLSVCYRCDAAIVREAQKLVPRIETRPDAPEGVVSSVPRASVTSLAKNGDMVVCRTNAPLLSLCFELIVAGKPATVKGRDIGRTLISHLDKVAKTKGFEFAEFLTFLTDHTARQLHVLRQRKNSDMMIEALLDKTECLRLVYENGHSNGHINSLGDMRQVISDLFSDTVSPIILSSVHKSKGLESDRVFILRPDLLPHPMAKNAWEQEQEKNLHYVAITRAKHELYMISETMQAPKEEAVASPVAKEPNEPATNPQLTL